MNNPTHIDRLALVPAKAINEQSWIICPNCKQQHGLFYRRKTDRERTLNYLCNKVKRRWWEEHGGHAHECWKHITAMGDVEFVDGLPIREDWTAKCKATFQKEHTADLLK